MFYFQRCLVQLVWDNSTKLGVGMAHVGDATVVVGQYRECEFIPFMILTVRQSDLASEYCRPSSFCRPHHFANRIFSADRTHFADRIFSAYSTTFDGQWFNLSGLDGNCRGKYTNHVHRVIADEKPAAAPIAPTAAEGGDVIPGTTNLVSTCLIDVDCDGVAD